MADFQFVTFRVATGATIHTAEDAEALKAAGITAVINAGDPTEEPELYPPLGIAYLDNTVPDDGDASTHGAEWFAKSLEFALPILAQPHQRIYAHCNQGLNRGPSTAFAIMLAQGFTPTDAEVLMRAVRPFVGLAYKANAISAVHELGYA